MKLGNLFNKLFGENSEQITPSKPNSHREVSFIHTKPHGEKTVRIVSGTLLNDFIIDYEKPLEEIALEVEQLLDYWTMQHSDEVIAQIGYFPKAGEIKVHIGGKHIDVVLNGVGSLDWFRVADHHTTTLPRK